MIIYRGPSLFDLAQNVVVVLTTSSENHKTGNVAQAWILVEKWNPIDAIRTGRDYAVCGWCKLRRGKGGACYVVPFQAPLSVWHTFARGGYAEVSPRDAARFLHGRVVRLGAYGDPAAVPLHVWIDLLGGGNASTKWVGYTHAWRTCSSLYRLICMASVDSADEALGAWALGWRTFRVRKPGFAAPTPPAEIACPASEESGRKTTCAKCCLCSGSNPDGARKASVVINAHGSLKLRFLNTKEA